MPIIITTTTTTTRFFIHEYYQYLYLKVMRPHRLGHADDGAAFIYEVELKMRHQHFYCVSTYLAIQLIESESKIFNWYCLRVVDEIVSLT